MSTDTEVEVSIFAEILEEAKHDAKLNDESLIERAIEAASEAFQFGITLLQQASETWIMLARLSFEIREQVILENGHPDWAGKSYTYRGLWSRALNRIVLAGTGTDVYKATIQKNVQNAVSNGVRENYIAEYVARTYPNLSDADTGAAKPIKAMKEGVKAEYASQVTSTGTALLTLPERFGGPKVERKTPTEPGSPEAITAKLRSTLKRITTVKEGEPSMSPLFVAVCIHEACSAIATFASEHVGFEGYSDVPETAKHYADAAACLMLAETAAVGKWEDDDTAALATAIFVPLDK